MLPFQIRNVKAGIQLLKSVFRALILLYNPQRNRSLISRLIFQLNGDSKEYVLAINPINKTQLILIQRMLHIELLSETCCKKRMRKEGSH